MVVSTPWITLLGWFVTERIVAPRFAAIPGEGLRRTGTATGAGARTFEAAVADASGGPAASPESGTVAVDPESSALMPAERRGLRWALVATAAFTLLVVWATLPVGTLPGAGFLRNPEDGDLLNSPFLSGIVAIIFLYGLLAGLAYGVGAGTIRSDADVIRGMNQSMSTLGSYLVLVFFAAQFVAFFNWTQLGLVFAVNGADALQALGLPAVPLFVCFILLTATVNLFMGSASAKWALMAPVFVPMFMLLGYSPELTQVAYRVGDSVTNVISPMMSYFALIIAFFQRWEPKAGIGTLVATMLPYSVVFLVGWATLFAVWVGLGLPIGPEAPLDYVPAARP
jgi:aminobenzoyl-glutamate transport protein